MASRADRHEQWAIFWCSLLQPLLIGEIPPEEAADFLRELTETEHLFPDGQRKKPSRATLYRKWKQYRDGGFEALLRKRRSDRRKPRKNRPKVAPQNARWACLLRLPSVQRIPYGHQPAH